MERRSHPNKVCPSYIAPQQKHIPLTCPWGCEEPVYRVELEDHAVKVHGQKPNPPKRRRKETWLSGKPLTEANRRDANLTERREK